MLAVADGVLLGVGSLLVALAEGELLLDVDGATLLDCVWVIVTVAVGLEDDVPTPAEGELEPDTAGAVVLGVVDLVFDFGSKVVPLVCEPLTVADSGLPDSNSKPVTAPMVTTNNAPAATASWRGLIAGLRATFSTATVSGSDA